MAVVKLERVVPIVQRAQAIRPVRRGERLRDAEVVVVMVTFPIFFFPCRTSSATLFQLDAGEDGHQHDEDDDTHRRADNDAHAALENGEFVRARDRDGGADLMEKKAEISK